MFISMTAKQMFVSIAGKQMFVSMTAKQLETGTYELLKIINMEK